METTRNPMTMLVFESTLRLSSVISIDTSAPAGRVTPFVPLTELVNDALNRSPTLCVFVHTLVPDVSASVEPDAIVPVLGAGSAGITGAGVGAGAFTLGGGLVLGRGADAFGCGGGVTGTSFNSGCTALSTPVLARSRAESAAIAESIAVCSSLPPQAVIKMAAVRGTRARNRVTRMINLSSESWFSRYTPFDGIWALRQPGF